MLGAEKAYAKLEQKLQRYLDTYEAAHNYDEYHFYLDEIEHDPYVLISILSALHDGVFTLAEVQGELEMLFEKQYILTETVTMQIRYRTKMMVVIGPYGVPQVITYQEPYEYYICTVKLKNKDLSHLPAEVLTEEQLSAYSLYMRTLGNRPDLFGKAQYPNASTIKQPTYYDIPPEALKDDRFAAMMGEATKYIGYPYAVSYTHLVQDCKPVIKSRASRPNTATIRMIFQFWAANSATRSPPSAASFVTRKPFSAVAAAHLSLIHI